MMNPAEFDNIARAEEGFWWFRGMRRILFGMLDGGLGERRVERVLEAGCGTGYFSRLAEQRYGWRMFPLDLGREGLEYARGMGLRRLVEGDIRRLPLADESFDAVFSLDVIVHLEPGAEDEAMAELARVLRPGGLLVLRTSALKTLRSRHSEFARERQRFTRGRLRRLAERHGVRVLRATYANSLLLPVALVKFRVWEPLLNKPPASGIEPVPGWLDRLLYIPLLLESVWLKAGLNLPLGQSLVLIGEKVGGS